MLDPLEEPLEEQSLEQEYPYNLDSTQYCPADPDPPTFQAVPPDPTFIGPVLPDPAILDPSSFDPGLLDPNFLNPDFLDPNFFDPDHLDLNNPDSPETTWDRPNCGNGRFGPNVLLCCSGLMSPGGEEVNGCHWYDRGKKICKNRDNLVCCQYMMEGLGVWCWRTY